MRPHYIPMATCLNTVWPSTPVCSKLIPASPSASTMICSCGLRTVCQIYPNECRKKAPTLSYHRFVHVPTCTPCCRSYVPHKKFPQSSDKSLALLSSRQTMNKAESTTARHSALFLFDLRMLFRRSDQIFRFSVVSSPMAFWATSKAEV